MRLARIPIAVLLVLLPVCFAQTVPHVKRQVPKPEPTQQELVEYIRGKLIALSPSDGINDTLDAEFDPASATLTITQPSGRCDQFFNALNASSLAWDLFDPGDSHNSRDELLRLTVASASGKAARTCYDKQNQVDPTITPNRARFLFSLPKVDQYPGFQDKVAKAFKKLIELSGGVPERELF